MCCRDSAGKYVAYHNVFSHFLSIVKSDSALRSYIVGFQRVYDSHRIYVCHAWSSISWTCQIQYENTVFREGCNASTNMHGTGCPETSKHLMYLAFVGLRRPLQDPRYPTSSRYVMISTVFSMNPTMHSVSISNYRRHRNIKRIWRS